MAAFGILAALRERDRSGEGQVVDVSMADGALSWLAMIAASYLADGEVPRRGHVPLGGHVRLLPPVRVRRRLGDARRAGAEVLQATSASASAARTSIEHQFQPPGSDAHARDRGDLPRAHARRVDGVRRRARLLPGAGARPRRGARLRARARARDGRRGRAARRRAAGPPARRAGEALAHAGRPAPAARARGWASTPTAVLRDAGYSDEEIAALERGRRGRRAGRGRHAGRSCHERRCPPRRPTRRAC